MDIRIRQSEYTINKLKEKETQLKASLFAVVNITVQREIEKLMEHAYNKVAEETKRRQQHKFNCLVEKCRKQETPGQPMEEIDTSRWVINNSKRILSTHESSVLKKGLNFAITPTKLPVNDIIAQTEKAARKLSPMAADSLRSEVVKVVKNTKLPTSNISKDERKALYDLKKDKDIMILPADKGRATVIMDTTDYKDKVQTLLADTNTYTKLQRNPTQKFKNKLINILREWKRQNTISEQLYWKIYPESDESPKFYGTPKIHKQGTPLRPIVSTCGSITYNAARYLADVLAPLQGNTIHSVNNTKDLVDALQDLQIPPGRKLVSFDVSALFTSVPVDKALQIIQARLELDPTLKARCELTVVQLTQLLDFCLNTTYFVVDNTYYQQTHGAAMGSPVSPIVCNIYMEDFEDIALSTVTNPPSLWLRYVDDVIAVTHEYFLDELYTHINSIDHNIQFTMEPENNGKLPFLDLCINILDDGGIKLTVYRKPTHTDQYLHFSSNHPLEHKRSVIRTLMHRAKDYITTNEDKKSEIEHVKKVLTANGYTKWSMHLPKPREKDQDNAKKKTHTKGSPIIGVPYVKGLSEHLVRIFRSYDIATFHKPQNQIRSILVHPKDKTPDENKCGVVYKITCDQNSNHTYIGETKRSLGTRVKEHQKYDHPTAVGEHCIASGHSISLHKSKILCREADWTQRKIKESIYIRQLHPTMNRDQGYQLPPVYNQLLSVNNNKHNNPSCVSLTCDQDL